MISLIPDESLVRLKQRFGSKFQTFTNFEVQALVTADLEEEVDNARMRQITSGHAADMTRLLQQLVSKGALSQDGQGRWTCYRLFPQPDSVHKRNDSVHKRNDSVHKRSDSVHKRSDSIHKSEIFDNEWDRLLKIAEPIKRNRRSTSKDIEAVLLKLCRNNWLTRRQLAELLGRNADGLRSRFLTLMVEHGRLCLRYPEKPNRVDQAYTSKHIMDLFLN